MGELTDRLDAMNPDEFEAWAEALTDEQDTAFQRALAQEYLDDAGREDIDLDVFMSGLESSDGFDEALVKADAWTKRFEDHIGSNARNSHDMEMANSFWRAFPEADLDAFMEHGDGNVEDAMRRYASAKGQLLGAKAEAGRAANPRRGTDLMDAIEGAFADNLIGNRGKQWVNPARGSSNPDAIDDAVGSFTEELAARNQNKKFWAAQAAAARDGKPV